MDLIKVFVYLAGLISLFAGAVKIDENIVSIPLWFD